jgi:ribosomal peptide maturation radical SAM protein 1
LKDILNKLLKPADVLMIIPPFALENYPMVGPHILQALAEKEGLSVQIYYANIHFASLLGEDYEKLCNMNYSMLGERLFAKAAWGQDLSPRLDDSIYDLSRLLGEQKARSLSEPLWVYPDMPRFSQGEWENFQDKACRWISEVSEILGKMNYPIVAVSSSYEQNNAGIALLKGLRSPRPETLTIIGGFQCEGPLAEGMASLDPDSQVMDYIFSGESEETFVEFLRSWKRDDLPDTRILKGEACSKMDALPDLDFTAFRTQLFSFLPVYLFNPSQVRYVYETSRGCWWGEKNHCRFCGGNGEIQRLSYRYKNPEKVKKDLMRFKDLGAVYLQMTDNIMPQEYFETLLPQLHGDSHGLRIYYEQKSGLSYNQLKKLRASGVLDIQPGIESFSDELLRKMGKGTTAAKNIDLLRHAASLGINVFWNLLWGIPGESLEDFRGMAVLFPNKLHLQPPFAMMHLIMSKFSPYFNFHENYGIENLKPLKSYSEVYPSGTDLNKLAIMYTADYISGCYEEPEIIDKIILQLKSWNQRWRNSESRPELKIFRDGKGVLMLKDSRTEESLITPVDLDQAHELLRSSKYWGSQMQNHGLDRGYAVKIGELYVSLIMADPGVIPEFEGLF